MESWHTKGLTVLWKEVGGEEREEGERPSHCPICKSVSALMLSQRLGQGRPQQY